MILGHCNTVQKVLTIFGLIAKTACQGSLVQVNNYEIVVKICHISHNFTDRNFVDNFLQVVIYLALVANI